MLIIPLLLGLAALLLVALTWLFMPLGKKRLKQHGVAVGFAMVMFSSVSVGLYHYWGGMIGLQHLEAFHDIDNFFADFAKNKNQTKEQVTQNLATLQLKVSHSSAAMARLGHIYNELGMFNDAITCFEQARRMAPENTDYHVQWIYSTALNAQGKLNDEVRLEAERISNLQPKQFGLMNILAIDAYFRSDFAQAIRYWQHLVDHDNTLSEERKGILEKAITKATLYLPEDQKEDVVVKVDVTLSKKLAGLVSPNDVVFVFVKSPGVKMPLAVLKRQARDLPFTAELTNKQKMMPGMPMKVGEKVEIIAKISASGDPLANSGVLRGETKETVLNSGINSVNIDINQS